MSEITIKTIELLEMLPESDQLLAFELIKKFVLAWDPDYTKLTTSEKKSLDEAKEDDYTITHDQLKKELGI